MSISRNNTVLVTGGRGFIGRSTVKLLQRTGFRVISLDRKPAAEDSDGECVQIECDLTDENRLKTIFESEPVSAVVHLAAILPTAAQRNPQLATEVNIHGSLNLLELSRTCGVKRFVFGSSLSVYGTCPSDQVVSELDRATPEDLYGAAKLYVEQLGHVYRGAYGLDFVGLRVGRVVGPGAHSMSSAWRSEIFELLKVEYPAEIFLPYGPSERLLILHVEDLAAMLLALVQAKRTAHAVYNAPCRSVVVADLKRVLEDLNSRITVRLGDAVPAGNPRDLDYSRFQHEFNFEISPIFDRLRRAAI